jgi:hypothetical protein
MAMIMCVHMCLHKWRAEGRKQKKEQGRDKWVGKKRSEREGVHQLKMWTIQDGWKEGVSTFSRISSAR